MQQNQDQQTPLSQLAAVVERRNTPRSFVVQHDCACINCRYNLRSLQSDAKCPECGTAVKASLRGRSLRFADPKWVKALAIGSSSMASSWPLVAFLLFLMVSITAKNPVHPAAIVGCFVPMLVFAMGLHRCTSPGTGFTEQEEQWRKVARVLNLFILAITTLLALALFQHWASSADMLIVALIALALLLNFCGICWQVVLLRRVVRHAGMWAGPWMAGIAFGLAFISIGSASAGIRNLACCMIPIGFLLLVTTWIWQLIAAWELWRVAAQANAAMKDPDGIAA